jgi:hypothetical protein
MPRLLGRDTTNHENRPGLTRRPETYFRTKDFNRIWARSGYLPEDIRPLPNKGLMLILKDMPVDI